MMIKTTWNNLNRMPWNAIFECAREYRRNNPELNDHYYREYMINEYGIDHRNEGVSIVDEQKYMLFLLRWT